jgi:hypothetical protein
LTAKSEQTGEVAKLQQSLEGASTELQQLTAQLGMALYVASQNGQTDVVTALIKARADVHSRINFWYGLGLHWSSKCAG